MHKIGYHDNSVLSLQSVHCNVNNSGLHTGKKSFDTVYHSCGPHDEQQNTTIYCHFHETKLVTTKSNLTSNACINSRRLMRRHNVIIGHFALFSKQN